MGEPAGTVPAPIITAGPGELDVADTQRLETEREKAWRLFPMDTERILDEFEAPTTRCRQHGCRAPVWWGLTFKGRRTCFDIKPDGTRTGTNHWRTCRDRPGKR